LPEVNVVQDVDVLPDFAHEAQAIGNGCPKPAAR